MNRPAHYHTKQHDVILSYITSLHGTHVTAAQIVEYFLREKIPVGRTTVYRYLDHLTKQGKLRKYNMDDVSGACYQYIGCVDDAEFHLHLKCDVCGKLQHLECDMLQEITRHISDQHAFQINALKTVLYGRCDHCSSST